MDLAVESPFTSLPHEILVELFSFIPTTSINNFYLVNSTHLKLFDRQHGLWEQLARKMFSWGASDAPVQGRHSSLIKKVQHINWKKEFRVASFIRDTLHQATFSVSHNPHLVEIKSARQFKGTGPDNIDYTKFDTCLLAILQSDTVLYPHPIGNFTTAYFEIEVIYQKELSVVTGEVSGTAIGGALKDYEGFVGAARSSYGMNGNADVFLESDFTPFSKLSHQIETGDIMGFGINFARGSIFCTKNGNIIHEAHQNNNKDPLMNLKNLHATISLLRDEVRVNMGSHPFLFDLLKYQQGKDQPKQPLRLFSEIIVPHLTAFQDQQFFAKAQPIMGYSLDRNLPKEPFCMPQFIHLLTYGVLHPNSKIQIVDAELTEFDFLRSIMNSSGVFRTLDPVTKDAEDYLNPLAEWIEHEIPEYKSLPWLQKVAVAESVVESVFYTRCAQLAELYSDELIDIAIGGLDWAYTVLAMKEFFYNVRPNINGAEHWVLETVRKYLDPTGQIETNQLFANCCGYILDLRTSITLIMEQRCKQIAEEKHKLANTMMKVSCGDKLMEENFRTILVYLDGKAKEIKLLPRVNTFAVIHMHVVLAHLFHAVQTPEDNRPKEGEAEIAQKLATSVLYGIYKLKISPDEFPSIEAYLKAAIEKNAKLITKEMKIHFLEENLKVLPIMQKHQLLSGPLLFCFGMRLDSNASVEDLRIEAAKRIQQLLKRVGKKVEDSEETPIKPTKQLSETQSTFGQRMMVVGIAGLICTGLVGGFLFLKNKLRK